MIRLLTLLSDIKNRFGGLEKLECTRARQLLSSS
jgi:hypothetical protein